MINLIKQQQISVAVKYFKDGFMACANTFQESMTDEVVEEIMNEKAKKLRRKLNENNRTKL